MSEDLVQLAWFELERALLDGAGGPLPTTLEGRRVVLVPDPDPFPGPDDAALPTEGWRIVHDRVVPAWAEGGRSARLVVMAASAGEPGRWVLLHLDDQGDHWRAQAGLDPEPVRPSRAARRRFLRLEWPAGDITATAGDVAGLLGAVRPTLTNTGDEPWQRHDQEGGPVVVHLTDAVTGERLPPRSHFAYAPSARPFTLAPGESLLLEVELLTVDVDQLPPRTYGLTGVWSSLDLTLKPGRLRLH